MYPVAPVSLILFVKCIWGNPFSSYRFALQASPACAQTAKLSGAKMLLPLMGQSARLGRLSTAPLSLSRSALANPSNYF